MPDWVNTEIIVEGNRKDLEFFMNEVSEDDLSKKENSAFSFDKIIPMPDDVSAWDKDGRGEDWYHWQNEHWGVKWGTNYSFVTDRNKYLHYLFDNPWSPAIPIFETITKKYTTMNFQIITYSSTDDTILEMKSYRGKLLIYNFYDCERYFSKGSYKFKEFKYDLIKNTKVNIPERKIRQYKPLEYLDVHLDLF
jgi:hypothetical protein